MLPKPGPRFSSALLPFTLSYVRSRGGDADRLGRRYLKGANTAITAAQFRQLTEDASKLLDDPLLGFHLALAMPRGSYGLMEFAVRSAPTARAALEQLSRYGSLINPATRFWLEDEGRVLSVHHRLTSEAGGVGRHGNLFTVARIVVMGRELVDETLRPVRVWFAHPREELAEEVRAFLGTEEVAFGRSSNGVSFRASDLDAPLRTTDPELNAVLRDHANRMLTELEPESIIERTRRAIIALLPKGEVQLEDVARKVHVSDRTLQRRLTESGVSFAELLSEVRLQLARSYLAEGAEPVAAVAARLGYRDAAAFGRAFKRWTGLSPGEFRTLAPAAQAIGAPGNRPAPHS